MPRIAGDERTYAVRLCRHVKLRDGDPCPTCDKPLGPEKPRKTVQHKFTIASEYGEEWVSISTVAGILDKSGALSGWAYNIAIDGVLDLESDVRGWTPEMLKAALKQQGFTPYIKKNRAATRGTEVHGVLERLAKGEPLAQVNRFIQSLAVEGFTPEENEEVRGYARGVRAWFLKTKPEPLLVESPVWSAVNRTVGTLDLFALRDRAPIIGKAAVLTDLKTSKDVYESSVVQLDGYAVCVNEMIDQGLLDIPRPLEHSIVLARPDGSFEERFVPSNPQSFLHALELTRAVMKIKELLKSSKEGETG